MSHSNRPLAHPRRTALSLLLPALLLAGAAQAQATPDGASEVTELDAVQVNAYRVTTAPARPRPTPRSPKSPGPSR